MVFLRLSTGVHAFCDPAPYLASDTIHAPLIAMKSIDGETSGRVLAPPRIDVAL